MQVSLNWISSFELSFVILWYGFSFFHLTFVYCGLDDDHIHIKGREKESG